MEARTEEKVGMGLRGEGKVSKETKKMERPVGRRDQQKRWMQRTHQHFLNQNARPVQRARVTITAKKIKPREL